MSNVKRSGDENAEEIPGRGPRAGNPAALPRLAAVITAMLGLAVLAGWAFAVPVLKSVLPGAVEMRANAAVGLVLAACALFILCDRPSPPWQRLAQALALAVAALGLATLGQYLFGWELGIDELLFRDTVHAYNAFPGRMAPYTSVAFALIGLALAALPRPALRRPAWLAAISVMAIGTVAYAGYLWNVDELVTDRWLPPVAVNTAFAFILLGGGTFLARRSPESQRAAGGSMVRWSIETRILAGFIGALALLFVAGGYAYRTSAEFAESARRVAHTHEVRAELGQLKVTIFEAESQQRNYLLSGEAKYKKAYARYAAALEGYERNVSRMVANNPAQMQDLAALRPLIVLRMNALARQVSVFERQGPIAALAAMTGDEGIQAMQAIDTLVERMDDLEKELLSKREAERLRTLELSLVALLLMLVLATAMLTLLYRGIRQEMAARMQTKDALRASEQYKRAILDTVVDAVITIDGRGNVETLNPAAEHIFGYAAAEVVGRNVKMLMPEPYHSQHDGYLEHYRATGEARVIGIGREVVGRRKDGSTFPMELAVSEMTPSGECHYTGIVRDITGRKKAEQALKLETGRLDLALRSAGMAMWNSDLGTGRVSLDERWTKILGGEPGACDTTASDLLKLVPAHHRDRLLAAAADITSGRTTKYRVEHQVRTRSGEWRWIESQGEVAERDAQGRALRMIGLNHDITERKQAEQNLVAARDEAERANATKDTFLATMSHEIRTPLNGLLGMLELLGLSRLDGEQRGTLEIARESGRGLVRIIDDVLDHAKIEAGMLEIRVEPVSIARIMRQVLNTYRAIASAKDLKLTRIVDPRISSALLADPLRVSQILNNLVSNAIKFTTEGYVEVGVELLRRAGGADTVRLSVKDTGIGIEREAQQRLFQPFEQAGAVTAGLYGGTGLGLSISRRLAEMMGGTIEVKSAPGEGTTMRVTLTLPISGAAPAERGSEAIPAVAPILAGAARGAGPLVLAVDDHPTNRALLARQIAALGLRVQTAVDGLEALALWQAGGYALIVTDCNMPQMDGYAFSRAVREIEAKEGRPRTPIIAWTANVLPGAAALCRAAGMDDILTKPAELTVLKATLSKWLPSAATATAGPDDAADAGSDAARIAPLDLTELDKIVANAAEREEILLDFMTQIRSDLAGLRASLTMQDFPACTRIAHRMKGSSGMVGARDLAAACGTMERAARQGSPEDAGAAKAAMERALERLEAHLAERTRAKEEHE
jgi:PAS domain S-box-containing protein